MVLTLEWTCCSTETKKMIAVQACHMARVENERSIWKAAARIGRGISLDTSITFCAQLILGRWRLKQANWQELSWRKQQGNNYVGYVWWDIIYLYKCMWFQLSFVCHVAVQISLKILFIFLLKCCWNIMQTRAYSQSSKKVGVYSQGQNCLL